MVTTRRQDVTTRHHGVSASHQDMAASHQDMAARHQDMAARQDDGILTQFLQYPRMYNGRESFEKFVIENIIFTNDDEDLVLRQDVIKKH